MNEFVWPVRVYYEDTDSGGVVYHSNYLNFMERARTEWLRSLQLEQDELINEYGIIFVVRSISIDYLKPALFNDALYVKSKIKKLSRVSLIFEQQIIKQNEQTNEQQLLTQGIVKIACLSITEKKPAAIPQSVYNTFSAQSCK